MQPLRAKYYVNAQGRCLGAFAGILHDDGQAEYPELPVGAVEVESPPAHGRDQWNGSTWEPHVPAAIDWDAEIAKRDPLIRTLVEMIPGGIAAVKAQLENRAAPN